MVRLPPVVVWLPVAILLPSSAYGWTPTTTTTSRCPRGREPWFCRRMGYTTTTTITTRTGTGTRSKHQSSSFRSDHRPTWSTVISAAAAATSQEQQDPARVIYSQPALYDLAFGYRDYVGEVEFLLKQHALLSHDESTTATMASTKTTKPLRILEVAAGPARHALTALSLLHSSGGTDDDAAATAASSRVDCIDASPEMASYALQLVARTDAERLRRYQLQQQQQPLRGISPRKLADSFFYTVTDMRTIALPDTTTASLDTAWILLGSLQHLLTNADVVSCFESIHALLRVNGTLFIELPHPREVFGIGDCTRNSWKVPLTFATENDDATWNENDSANLDDNETQDEFDTEEEEDDDEDEDSSSPNPGELSIIWGDTGDHFDPVTQVRKFTVVMEWITSEQDDTETNDMVPLPKSGRIRQVVPLRVFTVPEITALAQCAGFHVAAMYGALEDGVSIHDEDASYRFVCALQKR